MGPRLQGEFIAVVNAGSSSIKLSMFSLHDDRRQGPLRLELRAQVEGLGTATPHFEAAHADGTKAGSRDWPVGERLGHEGALEHLVEFVRHEFPGLSMLGIGHRVVHGGTAFQEPVVVTPAVLGQLETLVPLAPLHQPHNLAPIRRAFAALPGLPQVACFDTAFHRGQSDVADAFALPYAQVETFTVDYLDKNLRVKQRGGRTWNFTDKNDNADPLFVFHRDVEAARKKLAAGYAPGQ